MDRRRFLQSMAATSSGLWLNASAPLTSHASDRVGELLPQRVLGRTGEAVTMLGLGGAHVSNVFTDTESETLIEQAIEGGIRFFDTAASYNNGESERRYGRYLTPKYRDIVFLMTKTNAGEFAGATAETVRQSLESSLKNLKTDYLDLWQMHEVMSPDDVDTRIGLGVLDVMLEAKASGKVRHIGFTGHKMPAAHLRVLKRTDIFETCQMPVNCADPSYGSFIRHVMPILVQRNIGIIAMKTLACGGFFGGTTFFQGGSRPKIVPNRISIAEALHFPWSLPISVLVTGPNTFAHLQEKIELAKAFTALTESDRQALVDKVADLTPNRGVEFYKADNLPTEEGPLAVEDWGML